MEILSISAEETQKLAGTVAEKLKPGDVILLYGDLGSGKTTFARYLVSALGIPSRVQSPTFVLMRKYSGGLGEIKNVNHLDLYRITDPSEVSELGLQEIFSEKDSITLVEWPELVLTYLPEKHVSIRFETIDENTRSINVQNLD